MNEPPRLTYYVPGRMTEQQQQEVAAEPAAAPPRRHRKSSSRHVPADNQPLTADEEAAIRCCCFTCWRKPEVQQGTEYTPPDTMAPFAWRMCWIILLAMGFWPIVFAALYARQHAAAPDLKWYWMWPPLLLMLAHSVTWFDYHILRAEDVSADAAQAAAVYDMAGERALQLAQTIFLWGFTISGIMLTFLFAGMDYWGHARLSDGSAVDTLPAWLCVGSAALLVLSVFCRMREVLLRDKLAIALRQ